jgi:beta-glucosidase
LAAGGHPYLPGVSSCTFLTYPQHLAGLFKDGTLKLDDIDAAVRPILAIKVRMGLFEQPYTDESELAQVVALPEHREEARRAAQRSMVLLRNEGQLLPLAKSLKNVAVIGPLADSKEATEGSWMVFGHTPAAVTVVEGIRAKLPGAKVEYAPRISWWSAKSGADHNCTQKVLNSTFGYRNKRPKAP